MSSFPESVEEAGAFLGAIITTCGKKTYPLKAPPKGMHSSFSTISPLPSSELLNSLYDLRALLRSVPAEELPLISAPSLLALLMKLLGVSTSLAGLPSTPETPPMLSTALRGLWVDCVVLCHAVGQMDPTPLVRKFLALAVLHPRSQKAAGGVRLAALQVLAALFPVSAKKLAPWTLDVWQVCLRALRSAGNGEPTYRVAALRLARAAAEACRRQDNDAWVLSGAIEDKALAEALKLLKQAVQDKFPEVRSAAAQFAAVLPPFMFPVDPTVASLDDLWQLCVRNLDDESLYVAEGWSEALARVMCTAIHHNKRSTNEDEEDDAPEASRRGRAPGGITKSFKGLKSALTYLVEQFVKVGGELVASRAGGTYSTGGRAVRVGYTSAVKHLLRLQSHSIGEGRAMDLMDVVRVIMEMSGAEMDKQLKPPPGGEAPVVNPLFGGGRTWSRADAVIVRVSVSRVLRMVAAEPVQLLLLQDLMSLLGTEEWNAQQLQVFWVEISHLVVTLGEAAATRMEDLEALLKTGLANADLGVRLEAALAGVAMASAFPTQARRLLWTYIEDIQEHHAQLITLASSKNGSQQQKGEQAFARRVFRRNAPKEEAAADPTIPHQCAIHGIALLVAMLIQDLPKLPGGLPAPFVQAALSAAEILVSCQHNETLCSAYPAAVCFCVRGGFSIFSGILATGPKGATPHMPLIFGAWQRACAAVKNGNQHMAPRHELFCIDSVLGSIVVFLKYDSELLLSIPDALSQVNVMLEDSLALFIPPSGRFHGMAHSPPVAARMESATACLLEAFAWLPPGSFPMAADQVFSFAGSRIREAVENDVACSILQILVNREDSLLDSKTLPRVKGEGQVGGASDFEETILCLTAEVALSRERESILLLRGGGDEDEDIGSLLETSASTFRGSRLLFSHTQQSEMLPPTPLHEVGTWRRPMDSSYASKVRLVDAAIEAFAASFGLKSGHEQQEAMEMLESLVPPLLTQLARTLGVNASLTEQDRRSKAKEDSAAVANITAVLLACLQALPLHEATHNVAIGLGPPWMNKAKELLLTVLPSPSTFVRRAAAEGLALLATVGATEDAHFLQSSVLHSLDEMMQGNKPDGKPRSLTLEPVSAARAGSLLTLAYIQRTNYVVMKRQARARLRASTGMKKETSSKGENGLPFLQMMTRIIPSVSCQGIRDYFVVKTFALYSFAVLVAYSGRLDAESVDDDSLQLLRKGVEMVEENFISAWTAASADVDRGQESEKMACEASFLAVLLRLMTTFLPHIHRLVEENANLARRFCVMASLILDSHGCHPVIFFEAMAFFEVVASHQKLLPALASHVVYSENPVLSGIPSIMTILVPKHLAISPGSSLQTDTVVSVSSLRAAVFVVKMLLSSDVAVVELTDMKIVSGLVGLLESTCGSRRFSSADVTRSLAAGRDIEKLFNEACALETELCSAITYLMANDKPVQSSNPGAYLRWLLFARSILSVSTPPGDFEGERYSRAFVVHAAHVQAFKDVKPVQQAANPIRWQVKSVGARIALGAIEGIRSVYEESGDDIDKDTSFDLALASQECTALCRSLAEKGGTLPPSKLVFHLEELVACACMSSVASLDHAELYSIQEVSVRFLARIIEYFGKVPDPDEPNSNILDQYATQIFSSVKHALSAHEESETPAARRLFIAGCEALHTIVDSELTSDAMILKRLLRPIVLPEAPVFRYENGCQSPLLQPVDKKESRDTRSRILPTIGKLWTSGRILVGNGDQNETLQTVAKALIKDPTLFFGLAIQSAAAAVDGARLLHSASLSLAGLPRTSPTSETRADKCGFFHQSSHDIDECVKTMLATKWASYASCAIQPLLHAISNDPDVSEQCLSWLKIVVPLLLKGVEDACEALTVQETAKCPKIWAEPVDPREVLVDCLRGLTRLVVKGAEPLATLCTPQDFEDVIGLLYKSVVRPLIDQSDSSTANGFSGKICKATATAEACSLLRAVAATSSSVFPKDSALLVALLSPLDAIQKGKISLDSPGIEEIVTTSVIGVAHLILQGEANDVMVEAMLYFVLQTVCPGGAQQDLPARIADGTKSLLRACVKSISVTPGRRREIAKELALNENWQGWAELVPMDDGCAVAESLSTVVEKLSDTNNVKSQLAVLSTLRAVFQNATIPSPLAGTLLHGVGSEVLVIFYKYGSLQIPDSARPYRTTAFADSMKILLLAHQQLASDEDDELMSGYLELFFDGVLAVLRCNGLPNHPSPNPGGDPAFGRMCSQAILHIARASPVPFKTRMAAMADHDRGLMEFAVRGEMNGYTVANTGQPAAAPVKKKLSLKAFKK